MERVYNVLIKFFVCGIIIIDKIIFGRIYIIVICDCINICEVNILFIVLRKKII